MQKQEFIKTTMDSGMLILLIWVGVVFASIICTAAYFGGLGGAIVRCFSSLSTTRVRRTTSVTPVHTLQPMTVPITNNSDVQKGETNNTSTTSATT